MKIGLIGVPIFYREKGYGGLVETQLNLTSQLLRLGKQHKYFLIDYIGFEKTIPSGQLADFSILTYSPFSDGFKFSKQLAKGEIKLSHIFEGINKSSVKSLHDLMSIYYKIRFNFILPLKIMDKKLHILHGLCGYVPFYSSNLYKKIVTIYHIMQKNLLDPRSPPLDAYFDKWYLKQLHAADKIIAISEYTKNTLLRFFNLDPEKIKVIYIGIALEKVQPTADEAVEKLQPYLLYVGNFERRKNVPSLIKAFYKFQKRFENYKLVLAGARMGEDYEKVINLISNLNLRKKIILTGYVTAEKLAALYSNAALFVFPSFYEGFGYPPLEALQYGVPVITSNCSALPEIVGDAAITIHPTDINGMVNAMVKIVSGREFAEMLIKKGFERVKKFSWQNCALETLKLYEECV